MNRETRLVNDAELSQKILNASDYPSPYTYLKVLYDETAMSIIKEFQYENHI